MEAYIYDAVRTPRGLAKPTGALAQVHALELLNQLYAALLKRCLLYTSDAADE